MFKDLLLGVAITWITLTPEGKKVRDKAIKKLAETYLLPKEERKEDEVKDDNA